MNENKDLHTHGTGLYCPLLAIASKGSNCGGYCNGDKCAWWDTLNNQCKVVSVADNLQTLADVMQE